MLAGCLRGSLSNSGLVNSREFSLYGADQYYKERIERRAHVNALTECSAPTLALIRTPQPLKGLLRRTSQWPDKELMVTARLRASRTVFRGWRLSVTGFRKYSVGRWGHSPCDKQGGSAFVCVCGGWSESQIGFGLVCVCGWVYLTILWG